MIEPQKPDLVWLSCSRELNNNRADRVCSHDGHCSPQAVQLLVRGRESERAEEAVSNARDAPVGRRRDGRRAGLRDSVRELVGLPPEDSLPLRAFVDTDTDVSSRC